MHRQQQTGLLFPTHDMRLEADGLGNVWRYEIENMKFASLSLTCQIGLNNPLIL